LVHHVEVDLMHEVDALCSVVIEGKDQAVECKCMPALVQLLADESTAVRANCCGAIMMYYSPCSIVFLIYVTGLRNEAVYPLCEDEEET